VKCGECGKDVSDKAKACPNCGAPAGSEGQPVSAPHEPARPPSSSSSPASPPSTRRGVIRWALLATFCTVAGLAVYVLHLAASGEHDLAAPLSGIAEAIQPRKPSKIAEDKISLNEGEFKVYSFWLLTSVPIEVNIESASQKIDVLLLSAEQLQKFKQLNGVGEYTYKEAFSKLSTLKVHETKTLPDGEWAIVVQRPKESWFIHDSTVVSVELTKYE
jgi:hypothetical protein